MKLTSAMVVPEGNIEEAVIRTCRVDGKKTFHTPQRVMVYSAGGARRMTLWACEEHPLPDSITDDPSKEA